MNTPVLKTAHNGLSRFFTHVCLSVLGSVLLLPQHVYAASQSINLNPGWNLISFALLPQDKTPINILSSLEQAGTLDSIWEFDAVNQGWLRYPSPLNSYSEITAFETGKGYWIKVTSATTLVIDDPDNSVQAAPMALQLGWNLFGPVSNTAKPYSEVFQDVDITEIWQYDSVGMGFLGVELAASGPPITEEFTDLTPGYGYWVEVTQLSDITPVLGTALPGDIDVEPLLPAPTPGVPTPWSSIDPGDIDRGADGFYDRPDTQRTVDLSVNLDRQTMSVFNTNAGIMSYRITVLDSANTPWLKLLEFDSQTGEELLVTEINGTATTETDFIDIAIDRAGLLPGEEVGTIRIESNGAATDEPIRDIQVRMGVSDLVGDYKVTASILTVNGNQADLHNPRYFMSLYRDADGLKVIMDDNKTLLLPQKVHLSGDTYQDETNKFIVSGSFSLPNGHQDNPYDTGNKGLRRDITLIGDRAGFGEGGPLDLIGEYRETIRNVLGQPIYLEGTFLATRLSSDASILDEVPGQNLATQSIPDNGFITSTIDVTDQLLITNVEVVTNINHSRVTDVRVTLTSPTGTEIILRDQSNEALGVQTYETTDIPVESLALFNGELGLGAWVLTVEDLASTQVGDLNAWDLNLSGTMVYDISGAIAGVNEGADVVLTGCGVVLTTTTGVGGVYTFTNLIDCVYDISVQESGFERVHIEVVLNGTDQSGINLTPGVVAQDTPVDVGTPTEGSLALSYISTLSSAGLVTRVTSDQFAIQLGGEDAHDSATFDIDRPPYGDTGSACGQPSCPIEDSNNFTNTVDPTTDTNEPAINGAAGGLDGPVGSGNHYRMSVSIGQAVIGHSVAGNKQLLIGVNQ